MEYSMYYLVLRHLSGINKAVQTSHCSIEYAIKYQNEPDFLKYSTIDKTIVMLDGGTHQDMVETQKLLEESGVKHGYFLEPDINNAMTAICFLVDERLWKRELYMTDYNRFVEQRLMEDEISHYASYVPEYLGDWIKYIGGKENNTIYNIIRGKKLSS